MKLLDYLFFRVYSFYKKKKDSTPIWMGCCVLSVLIGLSLFSFVVFLSITLKVEFYLDKLAILFVAITSLLLLWRRYSKNDFIQNLVSHYKKEGLSKRKLRGWLFVIYLIVVFAIPISVGYMRHNLGMDI